ncbi:MAG: hotdog fold thioesterase [Pseudomonadales bacterium]|nr:hotdog fold thioesterase [Pseudomonadales bacterium]
MTIWTRPTDLALMNEHLRATAAQSLGIEITEIGNDFMRGRMPVDARTVQPQGIVHGGASVLLAETLGSIAANYCLREPGQHAVGLEINANHLRAVASGWVTGTARPIHLGGSTQVWEIRMEDDSGRPTCVSRLTMAVIQPRAQ